MTAQPRASIIIPTLNEAEHIETLLQGLLTQAPESVLEVLVADGGSTDGTREIVASLATGQPRLRLLHNAGRIQSAGVNAAARAAHPDAEFLIRIDAHAAYPPDYVARLLSAIVSHDAESVVVRLWTVGRGCFGRGVAAVCNGFLGTGGSVHRMGGAARFVDHGHHAAFRRTAFEGVGGYDEQVGTNEDAEFDVRLNAAGGRIWFEADLAVEYHPRESPRALARQYFRYGRGRASNVVKHRGGLKLRQLAPVALLLSMTAAVVAAPLAPAALLLPGGYAAVVASIAGWKALETRSWCVLSACVAAPIIHLSWAAGFLAQLSRGRAAWFLAGPRLAAEAEG